MHVDYTVYETLCIVYETNNHFIKKKKKNGSHGTIYTYKNYFNVFNFSFQFSIFNKISYIQTEFKRQLIVAHFH